MDKNSEIDVFEVFKIIYRWKLLIFGIIASGMLLVLLLYYFSPVTYTSTGKIKIGKIANTPLEKLEDLNLYMLSANNDAGKTVSISINTQYSSLGLDTVVYNITSTDSTYDTSRTVVEKTEKIILARYEKIFRESMEKFRKMNQNNEKIFQHFNASFHDTYTYPSEIIGQTVTAQNKFRTTYIVDENNKTAPLFYPGLFKYFLIYFAGLTFIGILSAFIVDFALSEYKKKK